MRRADDLDGFAASVGKGFQQPIGATVLVDFIAPRMRQHGPPASGADNSDGFRHRQPLLLDISWLAWLHEAGEDFPHRAAHPAIDQVARKVGARDEVGVRGIRRSTSQDVEPFWVYPKFQRNLVVSGSIGRPRTHMVMPRGLGSGTPLIQHGSHGLASHHGAAVSLGTTAPLQPPSVFSSITENC